MNQQEKLIKCAEAVTHDDNRDVIERIKKLGGFEDFIKSPQVIQELVTTLGIATWEVQGAYYAAKEYSYYDNPQHTIYANDAYTNEDWAQAIIDCVAGESE